MSDFARPTGIDWAGAHYGTVRFSEDNQKVVVFYTRSIENPAKSKQTGTRFFENAVFIKIHEPGERLNIVDRPVAEADKDRFPVQWNRFMQNQTQVPEGTLVDLLFPNNPAVADNLKGHGVYTIQQLARLSANAIDTIGMGAQEWVNMANMYLQNATDGSAFLKLQDDVKLLKQTIKIKDDQIAQLIQQVDSLIASTRNPQINRMYDPSYDVQTERINSTHITADIARSGGPILGRGSPKSPPSEELEHFQSLSDVAKEFSK
jgi:hypothetical protein